MLESRIIASSKPRRAPVCSEKFWEKFPREKIVEDGEDAVQSREMTGPKSAEASPTTLFEMRALKFGRSQAHLMHARCHCPVSAQRSFRGQGFLAARADDKTQWGMVRDGVVARSERFELPTLGFEVRCSIQLSYERINVFNHLVRSPNSWTLTRRRK
jgi:hypothetical protein